MTFGEMLIRLLKDKADRADLIETMWLFFASHVKIPPGGTQWIESRRCFFAGAITLFDALILILEPGPEPTDADLRRMDLLADELDRFRQDLLERRG